MLVKIAKIGVGTVGDPPSVVVVAPLGYVWATDGVQNSYPYAWSLIRGSGSLDDGVNWGELIVWWLWVVGWIRRGGGLVGMVCSP